MFHTPPTTQERSFIAEQESYGGYMDDTTAIDGPQSPVTQDRSQATLTGPRTEEIHPTTGLHSMPSPPSITSTLSNESRRSSNHTSLASEDTKDESIEVSKTAEPSAIVDPLMLEELASAAASDIRRDSSASTTTSSKFSHGQHSQQPLPRKLPSRLNHYIELFLNSLQEPKYTTPLTGDAISLLYQDFYKRFAAKADEFLQGKAAGSSQTSTSSQEVAMNSMEEIAERKKERSQRPSRINMLLELAEMKACSSVYDKIFAVAHGEDRVRSDFIQEKINVLDKFPITLEALGIDGLGARSENETETDPQPELQVEIQGEAQLEAQNQPEYANSHHRHNCHQYSDDFEHSGGTNNATITLLLQEAGSELLEMNLATYPKQKLLHLLNTHRTIVRILSEGKDSSADAILPCLIYTMIKTQVPNIWLNFKFIQRFRNAEFLNGESMYCLTNFEAAIMFLETCTSETLGLDLNKALPGLDVSCLVAPDPLAPGPPMSNTQPSFLSIGRPRKGSSATINSFNSSTRGSRSNSLNKEKDKDNRLGTAASLSPTATSRRLSLLQLHPGEIASSAADISIKSIGSTFGSSYRFLMGKISEKRAGEVDDPKYPHTLAEARKVVGLEPESPAHSVKEFNMSNEPSSGMTPSHSMSSISESLGGGLAAGSSPSAGNIPASVSERPTVESSASSVFGKLTGGVIKNFRSPSFNSSDIPTGDLKPPIEKFLTTDFENLKIADLQELHADYKRISQILKSNAFSQ